MKNIMTMLRERVRSYGNMHKIHTATSISYPTLYNFAHYNKSISAQTIERLARFFGYEVTLEQVTTK